MLVMMRCIAASFPRFPPMMASHHRHHSRLLSSRWCCLVLILIVVTIAEGFVNYFPNQHYQLKGNNGTCLAARGRRRKGGSTSEAVGGETKGKRSRKTKNKHPRKALESSSSPTITTGEAKTSSNQRQTNLSFPKTAPSWTRFERTSPLAPIDVCAVEVIDPTWWEDQGDGSTTTQNQGDSFGAKAWPSSLGVAKFLAEHFDHDDSSQSKRQQIVLELGCGTGIISQTVAASGCIALATDISPLALELTRIGWTETRKKAAAKRAQKSGEENETTTSGTLQTRRFDLLSNHPLPLPPTHNSNNLSTQPPPIVVASAVLYERSIARAVAKRIVEAIEGWNAWVILGDDETGNREGGRDILEEELKFYETKLLQRENQNENTVLRRTTSHVTVQNSAFGWREKSARILHLNAPEGLVL